MLAVLSELAGTASPHGGERALAESFVRFASDRWPLIDWQVRRLDGDAASVLATVLGEADRRVDDHVGGAVSPRPADVVLYSHLDTSLTGDPAVDAAITGRADTPAPFAVSGDTVCGFGLGVAKAPAAAAVVGFVRAAERAHASGSALNAHLLLAARGTHRTSWDGHASTGVSEYLGTFPPPRAAVVAKGGPPGVLRQEPAALYLRVRLSGAWGPLMLYPNGGLLARAGDLLTAVSAWGASYTAHRDDPTRQDGASFGLGALRAGSPEKSDLAPAGLELYCYLVLPGPVVPGEAAASLRAALGDEVSVDEMILGNGPGTPGDAPIIRVATDAYTSEFPAAPPLTGWTGSTDGVVFRAAGIPTARLGPRPLGGGADPRVDTFSGAELARWARVYERLISDSCIS
ncbi:hypothetical protein CryarDRAFT_0759 [Cryptosporangium arvum DSM 44712]|uniref:Acetylornithine deacetylase/succinyldiaminopimelate desuccinylase-like deacylase n=1 Tax=Cryptosporangium arvum DSM 44712 TaxID=927661 RepID=A0A010YHG7_9ACTN|nr:hypothetical protein CryarDRAFT_0759 [Cryptosporangium arvum DSM 44712]